MGTKGARIMKGAIVVLFFAFSMSAQAVPDDMDQDGDVDRSDFALFHECFMGPQIPVLQTGCQNARSDADMDIDLRDLAGFQISFTGGGRCGSPLAHDCCGTPITAGNETRTYTNVGATTDGPPSPVCDFGLSDLGQVGADVWYCYTASCTGTALVSLCGSDYDTKLAAYAGCGCPTAAPLACSDDDCGTDVGNYQSRVTIAVTTGQRYLVRVGGFGGDQGEGQLTIGCNVVDACANGSGDCFVASPNGAPGCGDATCCAATCNLDRSCCDVSWDARCASEAQGVCAGGFPACAPGSGLCGVPDATPGCDDMSCCNEVCLVDPFCCLSAWDPTCVDEAESICLLTCGPGAGDCHTPHATPGCDSVACCAAICTNDPYCCDTVWDATCVGEASLNCG